LNNEIKVHVATRMCRDKDIPIQECKISPTGTHKAGNHPAGIHKRASIRVE